MDAKAIIARYEAKLERLRDEFKQEESRLMQTIREIKSWNTDDDSGEDSPPKVKDQVIEVIRGGEVSTDEIAEALPEVNRNSISSALSNARKAGTIIKVGNHRPARWRMAETDPIDWLEEAKPPPAPPRIPKVPVERRTAEEDGLVDQDEKREWDDIPF